MTVPIVNLKAQYLSLRDEIMESVQQVFETCQFVGGPNVDGLEEEVAGLCEANHGVAVNSGTDALVIGLAACGVGHGDEVITTPFTFVATTEAIIIVGAKPVYVDIDPVTFNLDAGKIEAAITPRTKAILPVHLYGQCADAAQIDAIAAKHGLRVIYDGAQAIGALHKGKGIGAYGDASTLSFYVTKNLGGCGDGGMVLAKDPEVARVAKSLRSHGQDKTYSYEHVGYCSRLDGLQAAVLRVKFKKIKQWNEARRANAEYYAKAFANLSIKLPAAKPDNYHVYHQHTIRFSRRDELEKKLGERGIGSKVFYPSPLHLEHAYLNLGYKKGDFPESEKAAAEVLSLPVSPELTAEERDLVVAAVRESVGELAS